MHLIIMPIKEGNFCSALYEQIAHELGNTQNQKASII